MGLSSAVQWWQEWQLRILVLGSLFVHIFLFFADCVRRLPTLRRLRMLVWIAYIGGDALAVYALATLFNRHKQRAADGRSSSALEVEVVWAPVLLIHLGGQTSISAYSLEDNELWKRHAITLVSQVTVALYVFCKWWSGEKTLMQATVLLFVVGIIKFSQKPWALKEASFKGMLASSEGAVPNTLGCWGICTLCTTPILDFVRGMSNGGGGEKKGGGEEEKKGGEEEKKGGGEDDDEESALTLREFVQKAKKCVQTTKETSDEEPVLVPPDKLYEKFDLPADYLYKMFLDLSATYSRRLKELQFFLKLKDEYAYALLQMCLLTTFMFLYTKQRAASTGLGLCSALLLPFLVLASLVLFAKSHKDGYDGSDVVVTYILFCCTLAQEFLPFLPIPCFLGYTSTWHDMVSQYSLMSYCARKEKPTILMKLATVNSLRDYVNKYWYVWQVPEAHQITKLVHEHVKDGWQEYIKDATSYRAFNNFRGQRTLRRHGLGRWLGWSLKLPFDFDEMVLLWHVATDLCFHHPRSTCRPEELDAARQGREISNYMIYLLFIRPEMLMPGSRPALFTRASNEILGLKDRAGPFDKAERIARGIIDLSAAGTFHWEAPKATSPNILPDACRLLEVLMTRLPDEKERWEVIQGVWVEMLCYSAARSTGYLHAKSLGEGGEYLSYVWLLLSFMGMETLADKIHKPEPPDEEEKETAASQPQAGGVGQTAEISSSPA